MQRFGYATFVTFYLVFMFAASLGLQASDVLLESWVARYNGPGNNSDRATALAVDADGNVYVTGWSYGDGTSFDYANIKYDDAGNQLWTARYNEPGNYYDQTHALAVDADGNVYVTGGSVISGADFDYATIKYDADGKELWVARYSYGVARALAVDVDGNIYVTGGSAATGSGTGNDYVTVKYDTAGAQLWVARYNGPGNSNDVASALAVDAVGNVYVTGSSVGNGTTFDYATIKYNTNGNQLWVARYNGPENSDDVATSLAVDAAGNVYVTGWSHSSGNMDMDYATIKYDATTGAQLWTARYNGPEGNNDEAHALAVDATGNVYVTGWSPGIDTGHDYATIKYDATTGAQLWVTRYDYENSGDSAHALAVDADGNIYVTGESRGSDGLSDYATIKYDANTGAQLWIARYDEGHEDWAQALALAVDGVGNVYVTGWSLGDYTNIKYATVTPTEAIENLNTTVEDMNLQQGIDNSLDAKLQAVQDALVSANADLRNDAINKLEAFINAVEAQRGGKLTDAQANQLVALANNIISALGGTTAAPALVRVTTSKPQLDQNYPNPFNPETWIPYRLNEDADVVISIRSATGQLVRTFNLCHKKAGAYTSMEKAVHWDGTNEHGERVSSGLYFYAIQAGEFTATKKMIIAE